MFETIHYKNHKINHEKGATFFKWEFRYLHMKIITANRNVQLLDSEEEFIGKTKRDSKNTLLFLQCNICLDIVTTTTIDMFVNQGCLG